MMWINLLIGVLSAYYFGWKKGQEDAIKGIKPGEVIIEGKKILIPKDVYDKVLSLIRRTT